MKKTLIIGTGGTIASVKGENIHLDNPFKILEYVNFDKANFDCVSPFSVLSENIDFSLWQKLIDFINNINFNDYQGVIILHGSDTLAYTASLLGNIFYNKNIVLTASDKPVEDSSSNGVANFTSAVEHINKGGAGVFVSYGGIFPAAEIVSADDEDRFVHAGKTLKQIENPVFTPKNILVIRPYINIDYNNYNIENVDIVLHAMYHSATAPKNVLSFIDKCKNKNVAFYFVTTKSSADYESASEFENIIFNSTIENAYARFLLTK